MAHSFRLGLLLLFSREVMSDSCVTPWTVILQAPLSVKFPRREYWSRLPFPSPRDLPKPEIKPMCPGYCKQCCDDHSGPHVSFNSGFLGVYAQQWDCWVIRQF